MRLLEYVSYAKKTAVAVTAALTVLAAALADGSVNTTEWIQVAVSFFAALGVYHATNGEKPF